MNTWHLRTLITCWLFFAAIAGGARAQDPKVDPATEVSLAITSDTVKAWMQAVDQASELSEVAKTSLKGIWTKTLTDIQRAEDARRRAEGFRQKTASAPADIEAADKELATLVATPEVAGPVAPAASAAEAEQTLARAESDASQLQADVASVENDGRARQDRRAQAQSIRDAEQVKIEDAKGKLSGPAPAIEPLDLAFANYVQSIAQRLAAEAEIESLEAELPSYDARSRLLRTRTDLAHLRLERQTRSIERLRESLRDVRAREAEAEKQKAEAATRQDSEDPALKKISEGTLELVRRRTDPDGLVARIDESTKDLALMKSKVQESQDRFDQAKQYIEAVGLSDELARVLQQPTETKASLRLHLKAIEARESAIGALGLQRFDLDKQRREFRDPAGVARARFEEMLAGADAGVATDLRVRRIDRRLEELFIARRDAIDSAMDDIGRLIRIDLDLNQAERQLYELNTQYGEYVDARLVWLRDAPALGWGDVKGVFTSAKKLLIEEKPFDAMRAFTADARDHWPLWTGFVLLLLVLRRYRKKAREAFVSADLEAVGFLNASKPIFFGIAEALLVVLPSALLLEFVARRCIAISGVNDPARAFAAALRQATIVLFTLYFLMRLMRRDGLFQRNLGWEPEPLNQARHITRAYLFVGLPLVALYHYYVARPTLEPNDALARVCFIGLMIATSTWGFSLLRPLQKGLEHVAKGEPGRVMSRRILMIVLVGYGPLVIAALSAYGYHQSAHRIYERLFPTTIAIWALVIAIQLFDAWFNIARRAEAVARLRKRREEILAEKQGTGEKKEDPESIAEVLALEVSEVDLKKVNAQARQLVRGAGAVLLALSLWFIWHDVLPALRVLDTVTLWEVKTVRGLEPSTQAITIVDLLASLVAFTLTWMVARNLPGLVEALVLSNLPIDAGARYAIVTIMRYIITLIGVAIVFERLGVGWEDFQWLAAAVSVGLGFGLQEIFGNFVSGIILLFERPLRVGDTVTISGVSGIVTRIRMRATTILDGDYKEHIIPNKNMITGSVVNWVLSSTTVRVQFTIGVAYGTDTRKVEQLLVAIAKSHADVVDEPSPNAVFIGFGPSSLDFQLNAYVRTPGIAGRVRTELNRAIDEAFKRQGIEIPFPTQEILNRASRGDSSREGA